jgi:hypothetical protein
LRFPASTYKCAIIVLVLTAVASACGSGEDTPDAASPNGSATANPNTTLPPATVTSGSLPSGFPEDFPLYEGATPLSGSESAIGIVASLQTDDSYAEVLEFYREALGRSPWEIISEVPTQGLDASLFTISNDDDTWSASTVSVSRARDHTVTVIYINLQAPQSPGG